MRHYEVVYLIHEDRVDEIESVKTKVEGSIRVYLLFSFFLNHIFEHHLGIVGTFKLPIPF